MDSLTRSALDWIEGDPDPATRAELQNLVDTDNRAELESRLVGRLTFGTAGIRGEVGAGPNRMNRAVVIRTTAGLARYLSDNKLGAPVLVGFDARPTSRQFAEDTAGVLAAAGFAVQFFPEVCPTPLVAFAAREYGASAAVVVTASHNPPADNGYKVYGPNAAQIIPPLDTEISDAIMTIGRATEVPKVPEVFGKGHPLVTRVPTDVIDKYWEQVNSSRPDPQSSDWPIVYTPIHGVGGRVVEELFERAGHIGLVSVPQQASPDGTFPTVAFPNPEEPGALDLAIDLGTKISANLILANDPDADRLAVVISEGNEWSPLTGNQIGVLLGDYVLSNWRLQSKPIVINSIVSSPMLGRLAEIHSALHTVTLTGFKWIVAAGMALEEQGKGQFVFGYEEALGYTVGSTVRDKDGISAAVVFADLVAGLDAKGQSVADRLEELYRSAGLWASAQRSMVRPGGEGAAEIKSAVERLGANPPNEIAGLEVSAMTDYRSGAELRPFWLGNQDLIELSLITGGRILVRPSGTEPKLKVYVDLTEPATDALAQQQERLTAKAVEIAQAMVGFLEG